MGTDSWTSTRRTHPACPKVPESSSDDIIVFLIPLICNRNTLTLRLWNFATFPFSNGARACPNLAGTVGRRQEDNIQNAQTISTRRTHFACSNVPASTSADIIKMKGRGVKVDPLLKILALKEGGGFLQQISLVFVCVCVCVSVVDTWGDIEAR